MELDGHVGQLLEAARRPEGRRQHDRRLHHRQRRDGRRGGPMAAPRRSAARRRRPGRAACACRCWSAGRRSIPPGKVSNGIQTHEDLFTTLAAAAGVPRRARRSSRHVAQGPHRRRQQPRALDRRRPVGAQHRLLLQRERATAIRIGPWKSHFKTREGFFDYNKPSALLFNLRMDPFEQHGGQKADDMAMRLGVAWGGQVQDALGRPHEVAQGVPAAAEGRNAAARKLGAWPRSRSSSRPGR